MTKVMRISKKTATNRAEAILSYKPLPKQRQFHDSSARFKAFVGGVGSGKTVAGVEEAIRTMLHYPGSFGMIVAPTYPMLRDVTMRTFFERCPPEFIKEYIKGEKRLVFHNTSQAIFRSTDYPETLRGHNLGWIYPDEGTMMDHLAWKVMLGRLRLDPGRMWITATPKGFGWLYREFVEKKRDDYYIVNCTTYDNPYLSKEYVKSLEESYSGVFAKQEIGGQFVGAEGLVYQNFNRFVHIKEKLPDTFKEVVAGVDWGFSNPAVIIVLGVDGDDNYYAIEEFYQRRVLMDDMIGVARDLQQKWSITNFYCDPSEPQHIQEFITAGLDARPAENTVLPGINRVSSRLEIKANGKPSLIIHPRCVQLASEFESYRYPEQHENRAERDVPIKAFDHAMDAIRYVIYSRDAGIGKMVYLGGID